MYIASREYLWVEEKAVVKQRLSGGACVKLASFTHVLSFWYMEVKEASCGYLDLQEASCWYLEVQVGSQQWVLRQI